MISNITKCGGTERATSNLINFLKSKGLDVCVISLFSSKEDLQFFKLDKSVRINHLALKSYENKGKLQKIIGLTKSIFKLRDVLKKEKADVVIGTSRNTNIPALIFRSKGQKIIGCEHFAYDVPMNFSFRLFRNISYKHLDKLIVLTHRDKEKYEKLSISVKVIPNTVSPRKDNPNKILDNKKKIALAIGRHSKEKAFEKLIKNWKEIGSNNPDWKLLIIGEGDLLEYNMAYAKNIDCRNIVFLPFQKDIQKFYSIASIYFMTSLYEAFPMVLIEAKANGCVNIAYDCETGPREIIKQNEDGLLIDFNDSVSFIQSTNNLLQNENLLKEMQLKSIENSSEYAPQKIMPMWLDTLNKL